MVVYLLGIHHISLVVAICFCLRDNTLTRTMALNNPVNALNALLVDIPNVEIVLALIDKVKNNYQCFKTLPPFSTALHQYYQGLQFPQMQAEMTISRLHPFCARVVRDIHQIVHPRGHWGHTSVLGDFDMGKLHII